MGKVLRARVQRIRVPQAGLDVATAYADMNMYVCCFQVWSLCLSFCVCVPSIVGSKSTNEDVPAGETSIPSHLDHMLHLLCEEDSEADGGMVCTCACVGGVAAAAPVATLHAPPC